MSAKLICPICGAKFDGCRSCQKNNITSWKTVTDTENHFTIFTILHRYNVTKKITKEQAKELLLKCDLKGWENFQAGIVSSITKILKKETPIMEEVKEIEQPIVEPIEEVIEEPVVEVIEKPVEATEFIKPEIKTIKKQYNKKNTKR